MDHLSSAARLFKQAQQAFEEGDFATAVRYAQETEALVSAEPRIINRSSTQIPIYSIIIVTYQNRLEVKQSLRRLDSFIGKEQFEVLLIDNSSENLYASDLNFSRRINVVDVGFNYGCSGGRNLGARIARGKFIVFLDDDGIVEKGAVDQLIEAITTYGAVAVRGRVRPKSPTGLAGGHYDYGDEIVYSVPNTEGISIWRRKEFLENGGFDTLLSGHEGLALWYKMLKFHAPEAFLYTPHAVLLHDYATSADHLTIKKEMRQANLSYLRALYPGAIEAKNSVNKARKGPRERALFSRSGEIINKFAPLVDLTSCSISILTTARNATRFLEDYTKALLAQTHSNFEIVFVDDGSNDLTAEKISLLWQGDHRLHLIMGGGGRSAALNLAVANAKNEICVIANVDDISQPRRLELTLRHLLTNSEKACVSFLTFNERRMHETPLSYMPDTIGMRTRSILGMPASFGTFAFRKSQFSRPFDKSLTVGYDYKWINENFRQHPRMDGLVISLHQAYCQIHDGQISEANQEAQPSVALNCMYSLHEELIGSLSEKGKWCARVLSMWEKPSQTDCFSDIEDYAARLIVSNARPNIYDQVEVEQLLLRQLEKLEALTFRENSEFIRKQALALTQELAMASNKLSIVFAQNGNSAEAIASARRAIECQPDKAELHHHLGKLLQKWGSVGEAEAAHRRAIKLNPKLVAAHKSLSVIFAKQNRRAEALDAAKRSIELDPDKAELHHHLGKLLQKWGNVGEAEAAHRRAIKLNPKLVAAHKSLSVIFAKQNRRAEALDAAKRSIELDPDKAELHHHLGKLLQKWGRVGEAEAAHRRAIELNPKLVAAHKSLSVIFAKQNRRAEALDAAQRSIELDPDNAELHHHLNTLRLAHDC